MWLVQQRKGNGICNSLDFSKTLNKFFPEILSFVDLSMSFNVGVAFSLFLGFYDIV